MSEIVNDLPDLPPRAFEKADPSPDPLFYREARLVTHIDAGAIAAVTELYRRSLPSGGAILDLMSSWVSHLPPEVAYSGVTGHGMNGAELAANKRLTSRFVQDLNADPVLPLPSGTFDGACQCVSVQYLQRPVAVFREVRRVLRPGAPLVVTFSNRCFPTKAVAIWRSLDMRGLASLIALYLERSGFDRVEARVLADGSRGDPLVAVIGRA